MSRIRLMISGIASREEADAAVAAGADAVGLDPSVFPEAGLAGNGALATIALALPPAVTPVLLTPALTAGTIAQQVDSAAALVVRLVRPLAASEYPGLTRIIRGRKIIQSVDPDAADATAQVRTYAPLADALYLPVVAADRLETCRRLAAEAGLPVFLGLADPALLPLAAEFAPYALDLAPGRGFDLAGLRPALSALAAR